MSDVLSILGGWMAHHCKCRANAERPIRVKCEGQGRASVILGLANSAALALRPKAAIAEPWAERASAQPGWLQKRGAEQGPKRVGEEAAYRRVGEGV